MSGPADRANASGRGAEGPFAERRLRMVSELRAMGIRDEAVLAAFGRVPRELFVPADLVRHAYDDSALGIGHGQTISQPYIVARMTEALAVPAARARLGAPPRALDVGTGSGYQAAILGELGASVISIERDESLAREAARRLSRAGYDDRVRCVTGDGSEGWPADAPYDAIVVAAAAPAVPQPLLAQLTDRGRVIVPVGQRDHQVLTLMERLGEDLREMRLDPCMFVPLVGRYGFASTYL